MSDPTPPNSNPKIEITNEDLLAPTVETRIEQLRAAAAPQMVRAVGAPGPGSVAGKRPWYRLGVVSLGLAGLIGGIVGSLFAEFVSQPNSDSPWYGDSPKVGTIVFIVSFALGLGSILVGWAGIEARSGTKAFLDIAKATPFLLGGAIAGGWLAEVIYGPMSENVYRDAIESSDSVEEFQRAILNGLHFPRGLAWAIFGGFLGLAVGGSRLALRPAINGLVGGLIGGFIGGFTFDFVGEAIDNGTVMRVIGMSITGVLIGVAIGLVEEATKQHWLEIVSGGMAGKQFILFQSRTTVGAAPSCGVTLIKDPGLAPEHLLLNSTGASLEVTAVNPSYPMQINGVAAASARLGDGDLITIGSTILRYRSKSDAMPTVAPSMK
jgi:hypothetical protein